MFQTEDKKQESFATIRKRQIIEAVDENGVRYEIKNTKNEQLFDGDKFVGHILKEDEMFPDSKMIVYTDYFVPKQKLSRNVTREMVVINLYLMKVEEINNLIKSDDQYYFFDPEFPNENGECYIENILDDTSKSFYVFSIEHMDAFLSEDFSMIGIESFKNIGKILPLLTTNGAKEFSEGFAKSSTIIFETTWFNWLDGECDCETEIYVYLNKMKEVVKLEDAKL